MVSSTACSERHRESSAEASQPVARGLSLTEVATESGVDFRHRHGGTGAKHLAETMGSGGGFFDYNDDGWPDIYLVNAGPTPDSEPFEARNALFANRQDGTFENITDGSGLGDSGYGMGVAFGDHDNDGDQDVFVANFGDDALYRNDGDGKFTDVTAVAGVAGAGWSSSASFADIDSDGDLDLYVVRYLDLGWHDEKYCGDRSQGFRSYCHPDLYDGIRDLLYINNGDGRFTELGASLLQKEPESWRVDGKGLGIVFADLDDDGWTDALVANDSTANFFWHNQGPGLGFVDRGLDSGLSFNEVGESEAGMGIDVGDVDRDGLIDVFVTNLDLETNSLYRNLGSGLFADQTAGTDVAAASWLQVGFGTALLDLDNDGWLDSVTVNGHIIDDIEKVRRDIRYAQPNSLLWGGQAGFRQAAPELGEWQTRAGVSRGLASADYDRDGDLDLLVTTNNGTAELWRNDNPGVHAWLQVSLRGSPSNRDAYGARLALWTDQGARLVAHHRAASSYLSQHEAVVHFGLGRTTRIDRLEVRWPSGSTQEWHDLEPTRRLCVTEGEESISCADS